MPCPLRLMLSICATGVILGLGPTGPDSQSGTSADRQDSKRTLFGGSAASSPGVHIGNSATWMRRLNEKSCITSLKTNEYRVCASDRCSDARESGHTTVAATLLPYKLTSAQVESARKCLLRAAGDVWASIRECWPEIRETAAVPVSAPLATLGRLLAAGYSHAVQSPPQARKSTNGWSSDYDESMRAAERQDKMLLVYFCDACGDGPCNRFKTQTLDDEQVRRKLLDYVCVQVPRSAKITVGGKGVTLLEHPAFREMLGRPGVAVVDFRSSDPKLRGMVVSTFPITERLWYTPQQMSVILNLPPGTLTQRTLIYAVRIHPEQPASTDSQSSTELLSEAQSHSQYQAEIGRQGHHFWASRFQRIIARLPGGLSAREVCAESWPGQNLVEAAIECVRCWRLSEDHWSAVRSSNRCFGYDMKCGSNGVWYATGIFGTR
jgi:hypothetical protein